jgi:hypothetical protein
MKKMTDHVKETENQMLTEAATSEFERELSGLVEKYSKAMIAELQDQLKTKIADVLKKTASKI